MLEESVYPTHGILPFTLDPLTPAAPHPVTPTAIFLFCFETRSCCVAQLPTRWDTGVHLCVQLLVSSDQSVLPVCRIFFL